MGGPGIYIPGSVQQAEYQVPGTWCSTDWWYVWFTHIIPLASLFCVLRVLFDCRTSVRVLHGYFRARSLVTGSLLPWYTCVVDAAVRVVGEKFHPPSLALAATFRVYVIIKLH